MALGYNGDILQARNRAREAKNGFEIAYTIPVEGSFLWFTLLAIPRDAPHAANAQLVINYLMSPQTLAGLSDFTRFANANPAASKFMDASIVGDSSIYPPPGQMNNLAVQLEDSPERARTITRIWQKFKTVQ